jgi:Kef-type K+ transport system membrane component KefB
LVGLEGIPLVAVPVRRWRNRWTFTASLITGAIPVLGYLWGITGAPSLTLGDRVFWGAFTAVFSWVIALAALMPCVRATPGELIVDSGLFQRRIPWGLYRGVQPVGGMGILLKGGQEVGVFAFSGSLLGALTGDRTAHRVAEEIETYYRKHADRTRRGLVAIGVPVVRHAVWLLTVWAVVTWLPLLAHR